MRGHLVRLARLAVEHAELVITGRTHNVAAQATTLGKRFATTADELLVAFDRVVDLLERYPLRGIKGPVGTGQDMLDLLGGDARRLAELERRVARHLGFDHVLTSVGQVYPRSLDHDVLSALVQVAAAPSSLATTIRPMAGHELVSEGFQEGQVGSSAMPHKMNTRSCERVNGLAIVLRGFASMASELAGGQWNEGGRVRFVVRRVALPGAFFALDGLFETFLTVLDELRAYPAVIARELDRYLPFLATTKVLMAAVKAGVGRETAHEAISARARRRARAARARRRQQRSPRLAGGRPGAARRPLDHRSSDHAPLEFTAQHVPSSPRSSARSRSWLPKIRPPPRTPLRRSCRCPQAAWRSGTAMRPHIWGTATLPLMSTVTLPGYRHVYSGKVRELSPGRPGGRRADCRVRPDLRLRLRPGVDDPRQGRV